MTFRQDINDQQDPMISLLIYNYDTSYLKSLLDSILQQDILTNTEIIYIDETTQDGSWEMIMDHADRYPGLFTIQRNRRPAGFKANFNLGILKAKAKYTALFMNEQLFDPVYIKACVKTMMENPCARFDYIARTVKQQPVQSSINRKPLVSILCYNYNYGRFLRQCLESVFAQTYDNIELCFSDNASTDDSWEIACEFQRRFPKRMYMVRNRKNFGPDANYANSAQTMGGKYFVNFCSDDCMEPTFVESCVNALEAYPQAGFAMVNRNIMDEHDNITPEAPFYNRSCLIPGAGQAGVYMMAGINPAVSQIMYRRTSTMGKSATGALVSRYYGTRIQDFNITMENDVVYIQEALLNHRIHGASDTSAADSSLLPVLGLYVLNHQLAETAAIHDMNKVAGRLPESLQKLARLSLRYSIRSLLNGHSDVAKRYFHLSTAIDPGMEEDATWQEIQACWSGNESVRLNLIEKYSRMENFASRTLSYDPPEGSIDLPEGLIPSPRQTAGALN